MAHFATDPAERLSVEDQVDVASAQRNNKRHVWQDLHQDEKNVYLPKNKVMVRGLVRTGRSSYLTVSEGGNIR